MRQTRRCARPLVVQSLPEEAGRLAVTRGKTFKKLNERYETDRKIWGFTEGVGLPSKYEEEAKNLDLPVQVICLGDREWLYQSLREMSNSDIVIVVYDSEQKFCRRGHFNHSPQHNLFWRIRRGGYGLSASLEREI